MHDEHVEAQPGTMWTLGREIRDYHRQDANEPSDRWFAQMETATLFTPMDQAAGVIVAARIIWRIAEGATLTDAVNADPLTRAFTDGLFSDPKLDDLNCDRCQVKLIAGDEQAEGRAA